MAAMDHPFYEIDNLCPICQRLHIATRSYLRSYSPLWL